MEREVLVSSSWCQLYIAWEWHKAVLGEVQTRKEKILYCSFILTMRVVKHWDRLPREVTDAHVCQCSRGMWIMPSVTSFNLCLALK